MRIATLTIVLIAAAAVGRAAQAADDVAAADVRCLAVATVLSSNADPNVKNAGLMAALYYLGRVDGRQPTLDLEARLKQAYEQMSLQDVQAEARRCGAELGVRGKAVSEIGARLMAQAKDKTP